MLRGNNWFRESHKNCVWAIIEYEINFLIVETTIIDKGPINVRIINIKIRFQVSRLKLSFWNLFFSFWLV